ncbi:peptidoglycan-binding protein [Streptomyces sp. NPDC007264]|uniref:peptidoglycan-binding domain-containing protein n=1 Tax=Streptomyces sp. NPDC007264 TaxID=3364777 RepID=UPI0036DA63BE
MVLKQARNTLRTRPSADDLDAAVLFGTPPDPTPAPSSQDSRDIGPAAAADPDGTGVHWLRPAPRRGHAAVRPGLRDKPKAVIGAVVALLAVGGFLFAMSLFGSSFSLSSGDPQGPGTVPISLPTGFAGSSPVPSATARPPTEPPAGSGGSSTATDDGVLREGDTGPRVRQLQSLLHRIPGLYGVGSGETDGRFDAGVAHAVARFQGSAGISSEAPGVYGPVTQYALEARVRQLSVRPAPSRPDDGEAHEHEEEREESA